MKSVVVGGAVAAAMAVMPLAAADASVGGAGAAPAHVIYKLDPGGSGCAPNGGPCGSGGQDSGPGGGPGGQGCVAGVGCGFGGQNAGPNGQPGGCLFGVGCGHA
ncbi:PE-PGRS family protein [Mycobacterium paraterrae]|uniref:PE-PGRS family protein n=1 Tax=Mycobacterium paraterrae TaxID=577492 RepID=A0ABY3VJE0_9MYCO|nr:PE-PGRS family protein [Mycobacterium paraterrae]UMB69411.1 PE-PGRS family protein [Mycobacterium paraterrae]